MRQQAFAFGTAIVVSGVVMLDIHHANAACYNVNIDAPILIRSTDSVPSIDNRTSPRGLRISVTALRSHTAMEFTVNKMQRLKGIFRFCMNELPSFLRFNYRSDFNEDMVQIPFSTQVQGAIVFSGAGSQKFWGPLPGTPAIKFRLPIEDEFLVDTSVGTNIPLITPILNLLRGITDGPAGIRSADGYLLHGFGKGPAGVDHAPGSRPKGPSCVDFNGRGGVVGFPYCYGGHEGTDFMLKGGFAQMDRPNTNWVVAAANGIVTKVGAMATGVGYDRCHLSGFQVVCDGQPRVENFVEITHDDPNLGRQRIKTIYRHLARNSIVVRVNQPVACGQRLARIGSSGESSYPHLHFDVKYSNMEIRGPGGGIGLDDRPIDPFKGKYSEHSMWIKQGNIDGEGRERIPAPLCALPGASANFDRQTASGRCLAERQPRGIIDPRAPERLCAAARGNCWLDGACQKETNICKGVLGAIHWSDCSSDPDRGGLGDIFRGPPIRRGACVATSPLSVPCDQIEMSNQSDTELARKTCKEVRASLAFRCQ